MSLQAKKIIVKGRVQGVGFRQFTVHTAYKYSIQGTVKNLADGSVECFAKGDPQNLKNFIEAIQKGPPLSKVTQILIEDISPKYVPNGFSIIY